MESFSIQYSNYNGSNYLYAAAYYPFGMSMPGATHNYGSGYRWGYQGQYAERDSETGLSAFMLRQYDGRIGRWTTIDPYGQYWSPYLGVGNNPVMFVDGDGGWTMIAGAIIGGVLGGASEVISSGGFKSVNTSRLVLKVGIGASTGFLMGALPSPTLGLSMQNILSPVLATGIAFTSNLASQKVDIMYGLKQSYNFQSAITSGLVSGATLGIGNKITTSLKYKASTDYWTNFSNTNTSILHKLFKENFNLGTVLTNSLLDFISFGISNSNLSTNMQTIMLKEVIITPQNINTIHNDIENLSK